MWKQELIKLVERFNHPAWGVSHFDRVFNLSLCLAKKQMSKVDKDSLFAASYLHDIGAFEPYSQEGKDHSEVAIESCGDILKLIGFPSNKILLVKEIIKGHMFYAKPSKNLESIILHDADTLDFMGVIGITRLLSIVGKEDWTPDLKSAIKLIQKFCNELPQKLYSEEGQRIGAIRKIEMEEFLEKLASETENLKQI